MGADGSVAEPSEGAGFDGVTAAVSEVAAGAGVEGDAGALGWDDSDVPVGCDFGTVVGSSTDALSLAAAVAAAVSPRWNHSAMSSL
jgi:hypothetical protein